MEKEEKVDFDRKDGELIRYLMHKGPIYLNGKELGYEDSTTVQHMTKSGEEEFVAFGLKLQADLKDGIAKMKAELKGLDNIGHKELTREQLEAFMNVVRDVKSDKRKIKVSTENMDKLCGTIYRRLTIALQLAEAEKRLVKIDEEMAALKKVRG